MYKHFLILLIAALPALVNAQVKLPHFFSDGMMLQQQTEAKIWGTAPANEAISVTPSWDKKKYKAKTDSAGKWQLQIATPIAGGPFEIEIKDKASRQIIHNVLIGEVWLCSGQSNMDMPVKGYWEAPILNSAEILLNAPDSSIRLFRVGRKSSSTPLDDVSGKWEQADAASVKEFSAVAYRYGAMLRKHLGVPVAIIQSTWGGSPIEAWMDSATLQKVSMQTKLTGGATSTAENRTPYRLYNGMIAPLVGYNIAGMLWYQGEQNRYNYNDYLLLQPAMVDAWRKDWGIGNWPFYFVQIAPMKYPASQQALVPYFREVQLKLAEKMTNAGMAVSIDAGAENNIHPGKKEVISQRLTYLALAKHYGIEAIPCEPPSYKSFRINGDTMLLQFANIPLGFTTFGNPLTQFEVAGNDKVFHPATAVIKGSSIAVYSAEVKQPVAARYAFKDWATSELYGVEGLPVSSFRTDDW